MMGRARQSLRRDARGAVAVEFAIIAPIMIVIMAGLFELGHAFQAMTAVNALASQYAISWADCQDNPTGTCNTEITSLYTPTATIANTAPQLIAANVTLQMFQVSMTGSTPTVTYNSPGATMNATQIAAAQGSLQSGQSGVVVSVSYTYNVTFLPGPLNGIIPASIPMGFTVVQLKN